MGYEEGHLHPGKLTDTIHGTNGILTCLHEWLIFMVNVGTPPKTNMFPKKGLFQ